MTIIFEYATKNIQDISQEFGTSIDQGMKTAEASLRLAKFGSNHLRLQEVVAWQVLFRQLRSGFVYLLFGAVGITLFLGEWTNSLMILAVLVINTGLSFYQEYSSEKTAKLLQQFALPRAKVWRDGKMTQLTADKLVPGDVVYLQTGDKVPADLRLFKANNLQIDETVLTGESVPVNKIAVETKSRPQTYHKAVNLVFSGTDVLKGEAVGIVIATGRQTAFGQIAKLTVETRKVSNFEKNIDRFSRFILKLVGLTLGLVLLAHLLIGHGRVNFLELIVFAVALTVSVVPEALPLVTTFSLSIGARKLAKKNVIVKRLSAIEDLGGVEILCSDKTGTLTQNRLTIAGVYSLAKQPTLWLANLASDFSLKKKVEPFDLALEKGLTILEQADLQKTKILQQEAFDPRTRTNAVMVQIGNKTLLVRRGAPEAIIDSCRKLAGVDKEEFNHWLKTNGQQGHRVLAVGYKEIKDLDLKRLDFRQELSKNDFTFAGAIAFVDPLKKSAFMVSQQARKLGVRVVIITGDGPEVAGAVAYKIGLIDSSDQVITGKQWHTSSSAAKESMLTQYSVFARVSPEDKFAIIQALSKRYNVGFLGEGINDAPALKIAGVSVVVDSAADIAREAADIICLQKDLKVLIEGIREGRRIFTNTTKYLQSTLASNFGNFFAVAVASLMINFLPMLPIQILLVNLLSDTPMVAIATDTVNDQELQSPRKYRTKGIVTIAILLGLVSTVFDFIFFGLFYRISPGVLQTNWFIGSILTELVLFFSIRSQGLFIKAQRPSWGLIITSLVAGILTIGLPFTTWGQRVFRFTPPSVSHLQLILGLVVVYFLVSEAVKLLFYKSRLSHSL